MDPINLNGGHLKFGIIPLVLLFMLFLCQAVNAQHYTYVGGGMSLYMTDMSLGPDYFLVKAPEVIGGGSYDVTVRQEINRFFSLETGISAHNIEHNYFFMDEYYVFVGGFPVHKIPLKAEFEVDVFRDRMVAYASFGYQFCMRMSDGSGSFTNYAPGLNGGQLEIQWDYISDKPVYSLYQVGAGMRFRLVDELLFELELGYGFSLKDMVETRLTFQDPLGDLQFFTHKEGINYWYLQGGFSYPVQRVIQAVKSVLSEDQVSD